MIRWISSFFRLLAGASKADRDDAARARRARAAAEANPHRAEEAREEADAIRRHNQESHR